MTGDDNKADERSTRHRFSWFKLAAWSILGVAIYMLSTGPVLALMVCAAETANLPSWILLVPSYFYWPLYYGLDQIGPAGQLLVEYVRWWFEWFEWFGLIEGQYWSTQLSGEATQ